MLGTVKIHFGQGPHDSEEGGLGGGVGSGNPVTPPEWLAVEEESLLDELPMLDFRVGTPRKDPGFCVPVGKTKVKPEEGIICPIIVLVVAWPRLLVPTLGNENGNRTGLPLGT
jgi:hypothetical protein